MYSSADIAPQPLAEMTLQPTQPNRTNEKNTTRAHGRRENDGKEASEKGQVARLKPIQPVETNQREPVQVALYDRLELQPVNSNHPIPVYSNSSTSLLHANLLAPLVSSALHGFNSTIVCGGAPHAGKSRLVLGGLTILSADDESEDQENRLANKQAIKEEGILAFTIGNLFDRIKQCAHAGASSYVVGLSLFGITPHDHLVDCFAPLNTVTAAGTSAPVTLKLQDSSAGRLQLTGLAKRVIQSKNHAMRIMAAYFKEKATEARKNHNVAVITIEQKDLASGVITTSHLKCLDLASPFSSCVGVSGVDVADASARRVAFNPSLAAFEKVVTLLAKSDAPATPGQPTPSPKHIPFREAKLTRILKEGLGCNTSNTHMVYIGVLGEAHSDNKAVLKFASMMANISNVIIPAATVIPYTHSLHHHQERAHQRMKSRLAGLQSSPQTPASAVKADKINEPCATPTAGRVRRQLFDESDDTSEGHTASTENGTLTSIGLSTPNSSRRYAFAACKVSSTSDVIESVVPVDANSNSSPEFASPLPAPTSATRRWQVGPTRTAQTTTPTHKEEGTPATPTQTPTPTRRWTFKAKSALVAPLTPAESASQLAALRLARDRVFSDLRAAEADLDAMRADQHAQAQAQASLTPEGASQLNHAQLEREAALTTQIDRFRSELAAIDTKIDRTEHAPTATPEAVCPTSPGQFIADDLRDAFACVADSRRAADECDDFVPSRPDVSRLSVVAELDESAPCSVDDACVRPYSLLSGGVDDQESSCSRFAELMRRTFGRPRYFRHNTTTTTRDDKHNHNNATQTYSATRANTTLPVSPGGINLVNTLYRPSRDTYLSLAPSQPDATHTPASAPRRWFNCCTQRYSAPPSPSAAASVRCASSLAPTGVAAVGPSSLRFLSSDPAEHESADLIAEAARLSKLRKQKYEEASFMERTGCVVM